MANFCGKCGAKLEEGNGFCTNCGQPVNGNGQSGTSGKKWLWPVIISGTVLLLLAFGAWYSFKSSKPSPTSTGSSDSVASENKTERVPQREELVSQRSERAPQRHSYEPEVKTFTLAYGVKLEMVKVEPGKFTMSKKDGQNYGNEVEHPKTLTQAFYIGKYEVTQEQWWAIMGRTIREQRDKANPSWPLVGEGAKYPVYCVTWHEAMDFCKKMNYYAPPGWKFTLPTETQWEFAARGGNKSRGYKYSGSDNLDAVGWYNDNSGDTIHVVGGKSPNELGLYDMSGNVWELCLDNWEDKSNKTSPEFSRPYYDRDSSLRVSRGGSGGHSAVLCRSANRDHYYPGERNNCIGFRVALVPVQ